MFRIFRLSFSQIENSGKYSIFGFSILRILIGLLDLVGIGFVGLILTLALHSQSPDTKFGSPVLRILNVFKIDDASLIRQLIVLGCITTVLFLLKIVLTLAATFAGYRYLVKEEVNISKRILKSIFSREFVELQKIESAKVAQLITHGSSAIIRIIGYSIAISSDLFSLLALIVLLGFVNPLTMICSVFFFGGVSYLAIRYTGTATEALSQRFTFHNLLTTRTIQETYFSYKELAVSGKLEMFEDKSIENKRKSARAIADTQFLGAIPRAVLELSLVLGIVLIIGITWISNPSIESLTTIGIFLAASSKLIPALANLMASMSAIRLSSGEAQMLFDFLDSDHNLKQGQARAIKVTAESSIYDSIAEVELIKVLEVSFRYSQAERLILDKATLSIAQGDFLLISGPSGVGKSTFVDLLLGLLRPSSGSVEINGINATNFRESNRGSMAYVPQFVSVIDSTIFENVIFGNIPNNETEGRVIQALKDVDLWVYVQSLPMGLQTQIGERGATFSGGQRQRLGIARALYQGASLIVFDESTNALDAATEDFVLDTLSNIRGKTTIIIIAHGGGAMGRGHREIEINDGKLFEIKK
jgi:ABC-type bacteriocin/lantibiotic exporter with double-glycine peptidase domain